MTYPYAAVTVGPDRVRVYDLRTRAKAGHRSSGRITDLVLTRDGVATIVAGGQVLRMNPAGAVTTVDPGPASPGSLAVSDDGAHGYWMEGATPRSATFTAAPRVTVPVRRERCGRTQAPVVAADAGARLIFDEPGFEYLGCLGTRRPITFEPSDNVSHETIAAPFLGVVVSSASPYGSGENTVIVHDLRKTDVWSSYSAKSWVSQLELTRRGVAYILEAGAVDIDGRVVGRPELFRLDASDRVSTLDAGDIADGSLTLTPDGRRVYWTKDGVVLTRAA
jgi:hypothetical protein